MAKESGVTFKIHAIPRKYWDAVGMFPSVRIEYRKIGEPSKGFFSLTYEPESQSHISGDGIRYEISVQTNDHSLYPPQGYLKGKLYADFISIEELSYDCAVMFMSTIENEELKTWPRPPTVVVDIDGVIATGTVEKVYSEAAGWAYEKCEPIMSTIDALRGLKAEGVRIVLHTSRWSKDEDVTLQWLGRFKVPFDELVMGKPSGDLYIDDRNFPVPFRSMSNEEDLFHMMYGHIMNNYKQRKK